MKPVTNSSDLEDLLYDFSNSEKFSELNTKQRQDVLRYVKDEYIARNPNDTYAANLVANRVNETYLRGSGEGRYVPTRDEIKTEFPWEKEDWASKDEDLKEYDIEQFNESIPDIASEDPINVNDREFYLKSVADSQLRHVRGDDSNWLHDKGSRIMEGFSAGVASYVGADDTAREIRNYFSENPKYDEDLSAQFVSGLGDVGASSVIFLAGMAIAGGNPLGGTVAMSLGNGISRYQSSYQQAIDLGLDESKAIDAGVASLPGAVVDTLGDEIIAMKFLPSKMLKKTVTKFGRRELVKNVLKNTSLRNKGLRVIKDGLSEGLTEAAGDYISGYGAYLATDYDEFVPDKKSLKNSFIIGAALGSGISGIHSVSRLRKGEIQFVDEKGQTVKKKGIFDKDAIAASKLSQPLNPSFSIYKQQEVDKQIDDLLRKGKIKEAKQVYDQQPEEGEEGMLFPPSMLESEKPKTDNSDKEAKQFIPSILESEKPKTDNSDKEAKQFIPSILESEKPKTDNSDKEAKQFIPEEPKNNIIFEQQFLAFDDDNQTNSKLVKAVSDESLNDEVNNLIPERQRVQKEVSELAGADRALTEESAPSIIPIIDTLATNWAGATGRKPNEFYAKLNFKNPETLQPFNFIADKFISSTPDPVSNRRINRVASFENDNGTTIAASKDADVAALTHNFIGAMRNAGVIEDILGPEGLINIETELGITQAEEGFDQALGDSVLDWIDRKQPDNAPLGKIKNWISNVYQSLRKTFGPIKGSETLDAEYDKLFNLKKTNNNQDFGREVTDESDFGLAYDTKLNQEFVSDLRRNRDATNEELGKTEVVEGVDEPVTPTNSKHVSRLKDQQKELGRIARKAAKKVVGEKKERAPLGSLSTVDRVGGRIQAASKGVSFYYNLPGYSFDRNGKVKLGKLTSSKRGEVSESALKSLTGYDGTQIKAGEIELYKKLAPQAFNDGKVNLRDLIIGLEDSPLVIEQGNYFDPNPEALNRLKFVKKRIEKNKAKIHKGLTTDERRHELFEENKKLYIDLKSLNEYINPPKYDFISPKKNPKRYIESVIKIPENNIISSGLKNEHFKEHTDIVAHFRGYEEAINGEKSFHIIEVQSDTEARNQGDSYQELVKQYQTLGLKAAIQHAKIVGATSVVLSDAETAMMAQGHDLRPRLAGDNIYKFFSYGRPKKGDYIYVSKDDNSVIYGPYKERQNLEYITEGRYVKASEIKEVKVTKDLLEFANIRQEKGMRLNYDSMLPKLLKKLTKSSGVSVDMGRAKRKSKVLNKKNITGLKFDITNIPSTTESLFSNQTLEKPVASKEYFEPYPDRRIRNARELSSWISEELPNHPISDHILSDDRLLPYLDSVQVRSGPSNYFSPADNVIQLSDTSTTEAAHEITHALTVNAIENDGQFRTGIQSIIGEFTEANPRIRDIIFEANSLFKKYNNGVPDLAHWINQNQFAVQKKLSENLGFEITNQDMRNIYATLNPDEFIAAVTSDPEFRSLLKSIESTDKRTIWQKILDVIKKMFGVKESDPTILSEIDKLLEESFSSGKIGSHIQTPTLAQAQKNYYSLKGKKNKTPEEKSIERFFKRYNTIRKGKLNDRKDSFTYRIAKVAKNIRPNDVLLLDPLDQQSFFSLVDNIYESRTRSVETPALRIEGQQAIEALEQFKALTDMAAMGKIVEDFDGVVNFDLYEGDWSDRQALEKFVNEQTKKPTRTKNNKRIQEKEKAWRAKINEGATELKSKFASAPDYVEETEKLNGNTFHSAIFRDFLHAHYQYLTEADPEQLSGKELSTHFFALNNLRDHRGAYFAETTVKFIQQLRDSQLDIKDLSGKFRDPMVHKNRFLAGLDKLVKQTELMQTRLDRLSAFVSARKFLQNDVMGGVYKAILRESENNIAISEEQYVEARKEAEKAIGHKFNRSDRATMAMVSRVIQFQFDEDPDVAIIQNIENERQSIKNVLTGPVDEGLKKTHREFIEPILNQLVEGIEDSETPMKDFMDSIHKRMGRGDERLGQAMYQSLNNMMDIVNGYALDQEFISEGFYGKPFVGFANYLPKQAVPMHEESAPTSNPLEINSPIENFDDAQYQSRSMTSAPSQLKSRSKKLGSKRFYSNNIEQIFSRSVRMASLTASTTSERFILSERLNKNNIIYGLIKGDSPSDNRHAELENWTKDLLQNAMYNGEPLNLLAVVLKHINSLYARVALSGFHQGVTQTASGFTDYHARTGNIKGAMQASHYYATRKAFVDEWFNNQARRIEGRSVLGEQELSRNKNPLIDEKSLMSNPFFQKLGSWHNKAGDIITTSLRHGDDFSAKALILAEYVRLMKEEGKIQPKQTIHDVDFSVVDGDILTESMLNIERNINASNKILRGSFFQDRKNTTSLLRNITVAFSSHVLVLSAQLHLAVRDLAELHSLGASQEEKIDKVKTIAAILGQTLAFSAGRYIINGALSSAMTGLMRQLFDDDEGKIKDLELELQAARETGDDALVVTAEQELRTAKSIHKSINQFKSRSWSFDSFFKSVVREELGVLHFAFNGPRLPQKVIFGVVDPLGKKLMMEDRDATASQMKEKIKELKDQKKFGKAAELSEQLVLVESSEYIPFEYQEFGGVGLGGITGSSLKAIYDSYKEGTGAIISDKEYNYNDAILAAQSAGLGQADILRFFKTVDKIEDEVWRSQKDFPSRYAEASKRQSAQEKREYERHQKALLKRLMR